MSHVQTLSGAPRSPAPSRRLVDAPVRMFHWLSALCFTGAWLSAESEALRALHITLGYALAGLLVFRLLYGLAGPRQARLGLLWRKLCAALDALGDTGGRLRALQNLALSGTIWGILLLIVPLTLSGYGANNDWPEWVAEWHEVCGDLLLYGVLAHVAAILGLSLWRRRNLAGPMLTGRAPGAGPDLAQRNHAWLAALLLLGVLAWGAWSWHQAPSGLIRPAALLAGEAGETHDD